MVVEIDEQTLEHVREKFQNLKDDVKLYVFATKDHCLGCNDTIDLINIVADQSPKITIEQCTCEPDSEEAKEFNIDKFPATVIHSTERKPHVRYFGLPSGYEFGALIDDIVDVSTGAPDLNPDTEKQIKEISEKVHIQVFTTPTCPYCPRAVRTSHKLAMINDNITADGIDGLEFRELAQKYAVFAVPKIVINEDTTIEGAVPESVFVQKIQEALEK